MNKYDMVQDVKDGGTFLLNCEWPPEEVGNHIPGQAKRYMAEHNVKFYIIDGIKLGKKLVLADVSILYFSQHSSNLPISFLRMKLSSI